MSILDYNKLRLVASLLISLSIRMSSFWYSSKYNGSGVKFDFDILYEFPDTVDSDNNLLNNSYSLTISFS